MVGGGRDEIDFWPLITAYGKTLIGGVANACGPFPFFLSFFFFFFFLSSAAFLSGFCISFCYIAL